MKKKHTKVKKIIDNNSSSEDNKDTPSYSPIPKEIDTHYKLYGKHIWEIKFYEKCEICNSPFDEFGFCACGSGRS